MSIQSLYEEWLQKAAADPDLKTELESVKGREAEIEDRFYRELEFGTGGIRGVIGAGTNRMNYYTIARATQGLADYVLKFGKTKKVAIAFDSRNKSDYFARTAAEVFAGNGIKAYIYKELAPTPMLSFAVRALGCDSGCMVTASHNPAKYNGYKAYGSDGCQMTSEAADTVLDNIGKTDIWAGVKTLSFDEAQGKGLIEYVPDSVTEDYFKEVKACSLHADLCVSAGLKVVYTPLNGAGNKPVRRILSEIGIKDVTVVPEQELPDGNFPTCPFPNPEIREALQTGLNLCAKVKPDLLLATDPDCDRVGIAVPDKDDYALFSGNEVGAMLLEYICKERVALGKMPKNPVAVKSLVSTSIADKIAEKYNVELRDVLTGFKWIGEQIGILEAAGETERFIFGFEESYGYLGGAYVRDKDAVIGSMLICEMAAYYRSQGVTLTDARKKLYEEYGYYNNSLDNFAFEGSAGMKKMGEIMTGLRTNAPKEIAEYKVLGLTDYEAQESKCFESGKTFPTNLPKSDVIKLFLESDISVIIRPSGTEPKIKVYYTTVGKTAEEANSVRDKVAAAFKNFVK